MSASYRLPSIRSSAVMSQWARDSRKESPAENPEVRAARIEEAKRRIREADIKAGRKPWKGAL